jgi:hypothetical protein
VTNTTRRSPSSEPYSFSPICSIRSAILEPEGLLLFLQEPDTQRDKPAPQLSILFQCHPRINTRYSKRILSLRLSHQNPVRVFSSVPNTRSFHLILHDMITLRMSGEDCHKAPHYTVLLTFLSLPSYTYSSPTAQAPQVM